jgi:kynurenine formamidase
MALTEDTKTGNWGRWGAGDERGTLNLITSDAVLGALRAPTRGKVYSLGIPIGRHATPDLGGMRPYPERLTMSALADAAMYEQYGAAPGVGANEDLVFVPSHAGTHMDALCHVFADGVIWNGHPAGSFTPAGGAGRCGVERTGSFAGRMVLLDVAGQQGVDMLAPGQKITSADLEATRASQDVEVRSGDILLVRTGWLQQRLGGAPVTGAEPGLGLDAVNFVRDHDVAVVGADNAAIECIPFDQDVFLAVHIELLIKLGVTLVEHLWLADLAADQCYEGLFALGALPVTGATGSPVNPIVIG